MPGSDRASPVQSAVDVPFSVPSTAFWVPFRGRRDLFRHVYRTLTLPKAHFRPSAPLFVLYPTPHITVMSEEALETVQRHPPRMVLCEGLCQRVAQRLPTSGKPLRPFKEPTPQQQCKRKGSSHARWFKMWHKYIRGSGARPTAFFFFPFSSFRADSGQRATPS